LRLARSISERTVTAGGRASFRDRLVWDTSRMPFKASWLGWALVVIIAVLAGFYAAQRSAGSVPQLTSGTWLPQPRSLEDFALTDETGRPFHLADLAGQPTIVFFGFTHCPDVCPTTLARLAQITKSTGIPGLRVVLVSVDPTRDTPQVLEQYVRAFSPSFKGLTGSQAEIDRLTRQFNVAVARVDLGGGDYTMDHSAVISLLDDKARQVAVFTPPFEAASVAADLRSVADKLRS